MTVASFGFTEARVGDAEAAPVAPGIVVHRLYRSSAAADARRALVVTFGPGTQWPGDDLHHPGPEDVYVVRGTFHGVP